MNTFDALGYSESLVDIGVSENQARLQAKALSEAFDSNDVATASDIVRLESKITGDVVRLESKIGEVESKIIENVVRLESKITEMELRLIKWQIGGIGVIITVVKFL